MANSLAKDANQKEDLYSLSLSWCQDCNLVMLNETIDPKILFSEYVWVTGTSGVAKNHSQYFFDQVSSRSPKKRYVLEIASNDGTFLVPFIKNGYEVLGVDPAQNIVEVANKNGVPTQCSFFNMQTAFDLVKQKGKANIVFARNVLPHVANTRDFVESLSLCLAEDGVLAIEVHYAKKILEGLHYDSIYHEHVCYFTLKSLEKLLNDFNLHVFDISESPISGGSIIVYAKHGNVKEEPILQQYREKELEDKVNDLGSWQHFAETSHGHRQQLTEMLKEANREGMVAGYGASARSSTMLNFANVGPDLISVIADQNPLKQGLFAAGTHIPIVSPQEMIKRNPATIVILSWNFANEIADILRNKYGYKGRLIIPLPNIPKIL